MKNRAIDPNFSVWVSASAGSGKTRLLINRVLRLLLEKERNVLCLTFTNAAVNEMENRIYDTLSRWAMCSDTELELSLMELFASKFLDYHFINAKKAFSEIHNFNLTIQTIHAFCYKLISNFPTESSITTGYTLSECKELHSIVFDKTINDINIQNDVDIIAAEVNEDKLSNLLYTLYVNRAVNDVQYIKNKLNAPDEIHNLPDELIIDITKLAKILSNGSKRDKHYSNALYNYLDNLKEIESLTKVFFKAGSHEKKNISSIITKDMLNEYPNSEQMIDNMQNILLTYIKDINAHQIFKRTRSLLNIFNAYTDLYKKEKTKNRLLDYNDVINLSTDLLSNIEYKDWVLFNLDQKIDHILVDEAQDNSLDQWKIIASLCNEFFSGIGSHDNRTLFIVGDIKQSIYRFQGAEPLLFREMHQYFRKKAHVSRWLSCKLEQSFRSDSEILSLVDRLFNHFREEISFSNNEVKHIPYRRSQGYVEIWPLLPKFQENQIYKHHFSSEERDYISNRLLAGTVANKIHSWLDEGRILVAKDRHIEPKDIIILVRQRNLLVDYIISELKKFNIPVLGRDSFRIMDYLVIQDLIALAEFLLLPENDLALAVVLKSPLFNFTEDDLFNIAYDRKKQSLWEKLRNYSRSTWDYLHNLIDLSCSQSPLTLFSSILSFKNRKKFASRLGLECLDIINEFIDLIAKFEHENIQSLQEFVQWIKENNPEVKKDAHSEHNAVRVMTIHKAKGLEAPIVFLVDTTTVPRSDDDIIFDEERVPFWCKKDNNTYCDKIKKEQKIEDYNEYLRLLYVALTRAEDELYIIGREPMQKNSWYSIIKIYGDLHEKKLVNLYPMFEKEVEVLCINRNYPNIHKKRHYFDVPVIQVPQKLKDIIT